MKRGMRSLGVLVVCFFPVLTLAQEKTSPEKPLESLTLPAASTQYDDLETTLTAFFKEENLGESAAFSCVIADVKSGEFLVEINGQNPQTLSSLTKLYTTAAALDELDYDFRFTTTVAYSGEFNRAAGVIEGNLYLIGGGDPMLGDRLFPKADPFFPLNSFADDLKKQGVRRITGNVVGVYNRYSGGVYSVGWDDQNRARQEQPEVTALSFREAKLTLQITPEKPVGKAPKIEVFPDVDYLQISNSAVITEPASLMLPKFFRQDESLLLAIDGSIPRSQESLLFQIPLPNPPLFAAFCFKDALEKKGIRVLAEATTSEELEEGLITETLIEFTSPQLGEMIPFGFEPNNSLVAETIGREIALANSGEPSFQGASEAVMNWAQPLGLRTRGFKLVDCSGVSPFNTASAESVARLLVLMKGLSRNQRLYFNSLPALNAERESFFGRDLGKLNQRFIKYNDRLRFVAGDKENAATFGGYLTTRQGRELVVVIMLDKAISPQITLDRLLDKVDLYFTD